MVGGIRKAFYKKKAAGGQTSASRRFYAAGSAARHQRVQQARAVVPMQLAPARAAVRIGQTSGVVRAGEKKTVDFPVTNQSFSTTLQIALVNGVQQGTGRQNRIGSCVKWDKLYLTGQVITQTSGFGSVTDYARHMIIYDRQPTGTLPVIADIFADLDQTGATTNNASAGLNLNNRKRFSILFSRRLTLAGVSAAGVITNGYALNPMSEPSDTQIEKYINLSGLVTEFKSNSNPITVADIATGAIYMITLSMVNAAGVSNWLQSTKCRLTYYDEN